MDQLVRIWYARTTEQVADILTKSLAPLLHEDAVLLRSRGLSAHSVFLVVAGCLGPCLCAPILALLVRARGLAFRLGVCLLGFPAVVCAVAPFPTISSLCNCNIKTAGSVGYTHPHVSHGPRCATMHGSCPRTTFCEANQLRLLHLSVEKLVGWCFSCVCAFDGFLL